MNSRTLVHTAIGVAMSAGLVLAAAPAHAAPAVQSCTVTPVSTVGCTYKDFYGKKKHRHHKGDDDRRNDGGPDGDNDGGHDGDHDGDHDHDGDRDGRHHRHHDHPPFVYGPADKWSSCYAYCQ